MKLPDSLKLYIKYLTYEKNLSLNSINSYKKDINQFIDFLIKDEKEEGLNKKNDKNKESYNNKKKESKENSIKNNSGRILSTSVINLLNFRKFLKYIDTFKYSNNTIIRKYASMTGYFKFLENNGILKKSLSQYIMPPKKHRRLYLFLSQNEIKKMLDCIDLSGASGVRDRALIELIYSTGARVNEVENLKTGDISIEKNEARVFGKGRKYRTVYLNNETVNRLQDYFQKRSEFLKSPDLKNKILINPHNTKKEEPVFLNCFGKKLTARSIRNIVIKYARQAQIDKKIGPHSIRHTFATHLLQEGAGIREIQELLGHENISTTQIYTHLNIKKIRDDYKKYHPRAR